MPKLKPLRRKSIKPKVNTQSLSILDTESNQDFEEENAPIETFLKENKRKNLNGDVDDNYSKPSGKKPKMESMTQSLPIDLSNGENKNYVNDCTIYIEGLPFTSNEDEVRSYFSECGKIVSVRLPKWHDSGKLRGYGHIEFANKESVTKAFSLDGCDFLNTGRFLKIDLPKVPRSLQVSIPRTIRPVGCKTVFVKNLPYDTTENQIRELFLVCGPIINIRLAAWSHTNTLKGFGYIEFRREDSADIAVKKSGKLVIGSRTLIVDYDTGVPKGSYKNPFEPKQKRKVS